MEEGTDKNQSTSSDSPDQASTETAADETLESLTSEESLAALELPDMSFGKMISHFGPGIILMMTGIGTSHIITAPTAGGRFAYALMWCNLPVGPFGISSRKTTFFGTLKSARRVAA